MPVVRALRSAAGQAPGDHRRHGDGPRLQPLSGLRRRCEVYCHRVAGVVGLLSARHFRFTDPRTLEYARTSASPSSSPTSSATWARTPAATGSICRWTSCARFECQHRRRHLAPSEDQRFEELMAFQIERARELLPTGVVAAAGSGPQAAARRPDDGGDLSNVARGDRATSDCQSADSAHRSHAAAQAVDRVADVGQI